MPERAAVALTDAGLAAALKLEAEGVDVSAWVSAELCFYASVAGGLASYARTMGMDVRLTLSDDYGNVLLVKTNGRGEARSDPQPYVSLAFEARSVAAPALVKAAVYLQSKRDEVYAVTFKAGTIPDTLTTPAEWIAYAESLVKEEIDAEWARVEVEVENKARAVRNTAMLGS